ncbi:MAG TPA: ABC transporter permease, partial [Nonomuraea sp.]|nr:ABC transporter permease [Nonomuraea sp.]
MSGYMPFLVIGVVTGSIYGLSAMGLVLTYKTSGVFNIGHGAVCAASAYVFFSLRDQADLPWGIAALLVVFGFGPLAGLALERLAVVLAPVSTAYKIVGTVGLLVAIRAGIGLIYGDNTRFFPQFLPEKEAFGLASVAVGWDDVITLLIGAASALALFLFFQRSRLGTAMRGVVDDPQLLSMAGTSPVRVRRAAWIIGSSFASMSGVLFAAVQNQLDVNVLTLLVVNAFGAATIARFQSVPMAFVGGILVGVLQAVLSKMVGHSDQLQGLDLATPFLVLFIGLLVIPRGKLVEIGRLARPRPVPPSPFSARVRALGYGGAFVVALLIPTFASEKLPGYNVALTQVVLFASLHLLVRSSGQISLCHFGFAAVGAATFGKMLEKDVPFYLAVVLGGLACLPLALIVSVPAIRLSGLYLALATLGFGIVLSQFAYAKDYMFGGGQLLTQRAPGFDSDKAYYYLLLGIAIASVLFVLAVEHSRLGRLLRAMADSPIALSTLGTSVNVSRVIVFCISGFLAGISGALYASLFGAVTQDAFNFVQSLVVLAVLAIAGRRTVIAAFLAPVLLYVIPVYVEDPNTSQWLQLAFGLGAMFVAAASQGGVAKWLARQTVVHADR